MWAAMPCQASLQQRWWGKVVGRPCCHAGGQGCLPTSQCHFLTPRPPPLNPPVPPLCPPHVCKQDGAICSWVDEAARNATVCHAQGPQCGKLGKACYLTDGNEGETADKCDAGLVCTVSGWAAPSVLIKPDFWWIDGTGGKEQKDLKPSDAVCRPCTAAEKVRGMGCAPDGVQGVHQQACSAPRRGVRHTHHAVLLAPLPTLLQKAGFDECTTA